MGKVKAPHHKGTFHTRSAQLRAAAYADPTTRCWVCGRTLAEVRLKNPRAKWTAGHVNDGEIDGILLPECSVDNYRRGAIKGNKSPKRRRGAAWRPQPPPFPRSRNW